MLEWRVGVWDAETGETILGPLVLTYVEAAVYSPDETMIATGGWAEDIRFIKIWNVNTGCNSLCGMCGEVANEMDEYGYSGLEQVANEDEDAFGPDVTVNEFKQMTLRP
jgi:WD40 repeat protein